MIQDSFLPEDLTYNIIPINWCPTKFYSITFEGWHPEIFNATDSELTDITILAGSFIRSFIKKYKETHAFTEPNLIYQPKGHLIIVKIGIMEKEQYDQLKKKKESSLA